ncbi:MAG: hypothetical protein ABSD75_06620 [Terriglobales bacterium]
MFAALALAALLGGPLTRRAPEPVTFRQLNFRREAVFQAAFADKDTVVYSAAISGNTPQIYAVRSRYPEPTPLGPPGMQLLAISSKGELAVLVGARYVWYRLFTGTLARMPLDGGAPREIEEGVRQADWSPDGSQLAIIREVGGKDRLEYPIVKVLRQVSGYMSDVRISPRGDRIAYFEHPRKWDDRGSVNIVDLAGNNVVLSDGYWSERGLAWSPDGREILFSASQSGGAFTIYGITPAGKRRIAYQAPGGSWCKTWLRMVAGSPHAWITAMRRWCMFPTKPRAQVPVGQKIEIGVGAQALLKIGTSPGSTPPMPARSPVTGARSCSPRPHSETTMPFVCGTPIGRSQLLRWSASGRVGRQTFLPTASSFSPSCNLIGRSS